LLVKAVGKQSVSPTLSQRTRKNGAPTVLAGKNPIKQRWHKRPTAVRHVVARQLAKPLVDSAKAQSNPIAQKPSPAIAKGQATH